MPFLDGYYDTFRQLRSFLHARGVWLSIAESTGSMIAQQGGVFYEGYATLDEDSWEYHQKLLAARCNACKVVYTDIPRSRVQLFSRYPYTATVDFLCPENHVLRRNYIGWPRYTEPMLPQGSVHHAPAALNIPVSL